MVIFCNIGMNTSLIKMVDLFYKYAQQKTFSSLLDPVIEHETKKWHDETIIQTALNDPSLNAPEGSINVKFTILVKITKPLNITITKIAERVYNNTTDEALAWGNRVLNSKYGADLEARVRKAIVGTKQIPGQEPDLGMKPQIAQYFAETDQVMEGSGSVSFSIAE